MVHQRSGFTMTGPQATFCIKSSRLKTDLKVKIARIHRGMEKFEILATNQNLFEGTGSPKLLRRDFCRLLKRKTLKPF